MKCPSNTAACKVKKIRASLEQFGSPPTPVWILYQCKFCGYFIKYVDKNALSGFSAEPIEIEDPEIAAYRDHLLALEDFITKKLGKEYLPERPEILKDL